MSNSADTDPFCTMFSGPGPEPQPPRKRANFRVRPAPLIPEYPDTEYIVMLMLRLLMASWRYRLLCDHGMFMSSLYYTMICALNCAIVVLVKLRLDNEHARRAANTAWCIFYMSIIILGIHNMPAYITPDHLVPKILCLIGVDIYH